MDPLPVTPTEKKRLIVRKRTGGFRLGRRWTGVADPKRSRAAKRVARSSKGKLQRKKALKAFRKTPRYRKLVKVRAQYRRNQPRPHTSSQDRVPCNLQEILEPFRDVYRSASRRLIENNRDPDRLTKARSLVRLHRYGLSTETLLRALSGELSESSVEDMIGELVQADFDRELVEVEVDPEGTAYVFLSDTVKERLQDALDILKRHGNPKVVRDPEGDPSLGVYEVRVRREEGPRESSKEEPYEIPLPGACERCESDEIILSEGRVSCERCQSSVQLTEREEAFLVSRITESGELSFTDRYDALGIPRPDPKTMCLGQCEGTGVVPIADGDWLKPEDRKPWGSSDLVDGSPSAEPVEYYERAWEEAHAESPSGDGYHFLTCFDCAGTGLRPEEAIARWAALGASDGREGAEPGPPRINPLIPLTAKMRASYDDCRVNPSALEGYTSFRPSVRKARKGKKSRPQDLTRDNLGKYRNPPAMRDSREARTEARRLPKKGDLVWSTDPMARGAVGVVTGIDRKSKYPISWVDQDGNESADSLKDVKTLPSGSLKSRPEKIRSEFKDIPRWKKYKADEVEKFIKSYTYEGLDEDSGSALKEGSMVRLTTEAADELLEDPKATGEIVKAETRKGSGGKYTVKWEDGGASIHPGKDLVSAAVARGPVVDLGEQKREVPVGRGNVVAIGIGRGARGPNYYIKTKSGLKDYPAEPPGTTPEKQLTRFRYMLSQALASSQDADRFIQRLTGESSRRGGLESGVPIVFDEDGSAGGYKPWSRDAAGLSDREEEIGDPALSNEDPGKETHLPSELDGEEGRDKGVRGEPAQKESMDDAISQANYAPASGLRKCGNCSHFTGEGNCDLFSFNADPGYTCDRWEKGKVAKEGVEIVFREGSLPKPQWDHLGDDTEPLEEGLKDQAMRLVSVYLAAKRSGNVSRQQKAYEKIRAFADKHGLDFDNVLTGATKALAKKNPIAHRMGGLDTGDESLTEATGTTQFDGGEVLIDTLEKRPLRVDDVTADTLRFRDWSRVGSPGEQETIRLDLAKSRLASGTLIRTGQNFAEGQEPEWVSLEFEAEARPTKVGSWAKLLPTDRKPPKAELEVVKA